MNHCCQKMRQDKGADPYVANVARNAIRNQNFRTAIWSGCNLQMTLMCIPVCGEIGLEIHEDTDQIVRIEQGCAVAKMGCCRNNLDFQQNMQKDEVVFIPAGMWHNIVNIGRCPLKISVVYAPPNHPWGTVHRTKADAEREAY